MRLNVCARLPADHPFQPLVIESLQSIPADAEVISEPAVPESANHEESSSSHPKPTTQTSESSILDELVNHYSIELPGFEPNLEKASEIAFEEVILEDPQQQQSKQRPESPNQTLEESYQEQILVGQQVSQTSIEQITDPDFMITSDHSDGKDEQTNS